MYITNGPTTVFLSPLGGVITSWQHGETQVLFPQQMVEFPERMRLRGGLHPCFPNFGAAPESNPSLGQHGFLRNSIAKHIACAGKRASFGFESNEEGYPWDHSVVVQVTAEESGFNYELVIQNLDPADLPMPICPGLHPYFRTPCGALTAKPTNRRGRVFSMTDVGSEEVLISQGGIAEHELYIAGAGKVILTPSGDISSENSKTIFWRDDRRYACLEYVAGDHRSFGMPNGKWLKHGEVFRLSCRFRFIPE